LKAIPISSKASFQNNVAGKTENNIPPSATVSKPHLAFLFYLNNFTNQPKLGCPCFREIDYYAEYAGNDS
jgi:hypothetical protein